MAKQIHEPARAKAMGAALPEPQSISHALDAGDKVSHVAVQSELRHPGARIR